MESISRSKEPGLAALAKEAPDAVRKMGKDPEKIKMKSGGVIEKKKKKKKKSSGAPQTSLRPKARPVSKEEDKESLLRRTRDGTGLTTKSLLQPRADGTGLTTDPKKMMRGGEVKFGHGGKVHGCNSGIQMSGMREAKTY